MQLNFNAEIYRNASAFYSDAVLEASTSYTDLSLVPAIGDLQYFPQLTAEVRALELALGQLEEKLDEVIIMLKALAVIAEPANKLKVLPIIGLMDQQVEPYVNFYLVEMKCRNEKVGNKENK
ncbi:MAG: hypothetical protein H0W62_02045 [Chitinophagales bacterium]|nr:hypothetical protein [Chitinophagales bacterium]